MTRAPLHRRAESHRYALSEARAALLARVPRLPPEALLALLEASFAFVGIPELRAVPLAVLDSLQPVPATFLKQLSTDQELFHELPRGVQRQVGPHTPRALSPFVRSLAPQQQPSSRETHV